MKPRKNPAQLLKFAMENAGDDVQLAAVAPATFGMRRENRKRGVPASIVVEFPDEIVKNLMDPELADLVLLVRIPRAVVNRAELGLVSAGLVDVQGRRIS